MRDLHKSILVALLLLLIAALAAILFTRSWEDSPRRLHADLTKSTHTEQLVDTSALDTAQQLSPLAITHWERQYADEALRLADRSVDSAFTSALTDAVENPAPLTPETRELFSHLKDTESRVAADQSNIAQLTTQIAKASAAQKAHIQESLDLAQAQLALDQDELDDAHQDLIRAGADKHALIQKQLDAHEASEVHTAKSPSAPAATSAAAPSESNTAAATPVASPESSKSKSLLTQIEAVLSFRTKESLLEQARANALKRAATLTAAHEVLEKQLDQEKSEKTIIRKHGKILRTADAKPHVESAEEVSAKSANTSGKELSAVEPSEPLSQLSFIQHLNADQKMLALYDKRIADEQGLAATYANWNALVFARHRSFLHSIFYSALWIILIALFVFIANIWVQTLFAKLDIDRREMHTMRAILLFAVQAVGVVLILLVIFGVPNDFATVAALTGAGITVAMKDFIVGFFGWFILMGKNGIRPGDWVEINGTAGEVVKVGLLHTVLLETGSWVDAGHPTGRKVTFVNSFAIEGHYFNFSTSGQWLWDEIQIQVPNTQDPWTTAEAVRKLAADETKSNAKLAEQEWGRVTSDSAKSGFSAEPSLSVKPSGSGVDVRVRYLTRANERHETRARLYHAVVDMLHASANPASVVAKPAT
jgi:small-conductance mechanosensitive channel